MTGIKPRAVYAVDRHAGMRMRVCYAVVFCVVLPALLVAWAALMPMALPAVHEPWLGAGLTLVGVGLLVGGMWALWTRGGGLPMNVAPPPRFVSTGVYALSSHPIYLGFCLACLGVSLWFASAAGLWVICPLVVAGCFALVWGYERHDLLARFEGAYQRYEPLLSLPPAGDTAPTLKQRLGVYLVVLAPWLGLYELLALVPPSPHALSTALDFERDWPVWQWAELIYGSTYLGVLLVPLLVQPRTTLRRFAVDGLWGTAIGIFCFVVLPLTFAPRPFEPQSFAGHLLAFERQCDPAIVNACPSFHGFWALLVATTLAPRSRRWAIASWLWAIAVILSCVATAMHGVVDMLAALALFLLVRNLGDFYRMALHACEHLANSYRFWRVGPIRIINHAAWSFAAGAVGVLLIGYLAGPSCLPAVILVAMASLIGAMLWAQFIEGSPRLLRPFGYYGAIVGGVLGCLGAWLLGTSPWLILAATAAAAPAIQAIGRVRCLVQGCCHGKQSSELVGLRVHNRSSRVCVLAHLDGLPIHPTQFYSILGNLIAGGLLLRLYLAGCSQNIIVGLYLAMAGLSRFVEESYRGEPQTRKWHGLPEYQWLAILSVLIGCILLAIPMSSPVPLPEASPALPWAATLIGCVTAIMMSVDFPDSNRRFARLTG